ncbi:hypothetical protein ACFQ4M_15815 [Thauera mechernichensis]|uniref:Uncharacterized protein n=1 Tax=Thauera mechernichensis TaxID=82788 RepID=A0ABW3WJ94_9RHOO|nr:hypothetical protein [Thauera mechernichensis]MDG3063279.1 hypothetical protein [Thauera mechernichensis]
MDSLILEAVILGAACLLGLYAIAESVSRAGSEIAAAIALVEEADE